MYYDPRVYNYSQLNKDDQKTFDDMIFYLMNPVDEQIDEYRDELRCEKVVLNQIKLQNCIFALKQMKERLVGQLIEFLVNTIENYDGVLEEEDLTDTDDYFFGCPYVEDGDDDEDEDDEYEISGVNPLEALISEETKERKTKNENGSNQ